MTSEQKYCKRIAKETLTWKQNESERLETLRNEERNPMVRASIQTRINILQKAIIAEMAGALNS